MKHGYYIVLVLALHFVLHFCIKDKLHATGDSTFYSRKALISADVSLFAAFPLTKVPSGHPYSHKILWLRTRVYGGIFVSKNIAIGVVGKQSFVTSNFYERPTFYGVGYWTRYYPSFIDPHLRWRILKSWIQLYPFFQAEHMVSNFISYGQMEGLKTAFHNHVITPSLGFHYRLGKRFTLDFQLWGYIFISPELGSPTSTSPLFKNSVSYFFQ